MSATRFPPIQVDGYHRRMVMPTRTGRDVYTPARLNLETRTLLEKEFGLLWIEGELSNLARPSSGHLYFSLKDARAQVRCAMFRNRNRLLRFRPADGQQVLLRARVSLYEGRGEFQLIVESMEEAGHGALQRAFEALQGKLAAEGLFDDAHKQPLPALPHQVGVISSPSSAALRDVLHVLERRFRALPVIVYPATVQGTDAPASLRAALAAAVHRAECDVLLIVRGGGSLEDLWAFNDEGLVRDLHRCPIPIVSGVGHETDVTLTDFVADLRAPTPSAAAERASPDGEAWHLRLAELGRRLVLRQRSALARHAERLGWLARHLQIHHPEQSLRERSQRIDEIEQRLRRGWQVQRQNSEQRLILARTALSMHTPAARLATLHGTQASLDHRLRLAMRHLLDDRDRLLGSTVRALDVVSPLATLGRGYAIVSDRDDRILRRAGDCAVGDRIEARLAEGRLQCRVETVIDKES